jgi:hypothetical protein
MKSFALFLLLIFFSCGLNATVYYVDSARPDNSGNGLSWAAAKRDLPGFVNGSYQGWNISAGDTCYISSGTYNLAGYWDPPSGTAGNLCTYQIGQDVGHNGIAVFNLTGGASQFFTAQNYCVLSGDAGDGLKHFKLTTGWSAIWYGSGGSPITQRRYSYIDCTDGITYMGAFQNASAIEVDHCDVLINDLGSGASNGIAGGFTTAAFDDVKFHHNWLRIPYGATAGWGSDGLAFGGSGWSVYNCFIQGYYAPSYASSQHGDGLQSLGGSYIKIYNNTFLDFTNYGIFLECYGSGYINTYVYNNIVGLTDSALSGTGSFTAAIVVGGNSAYISAGSPIPMIMTNVVVANNISINFKVTSSTISIANAPGQIPSVTYTNCAVKNNLSIDTLNNATGEAGVTVSNNILMDSATAAPLFLRYVEFAGTANDLHPKAGASSLIGQGADLSAYFTTDYTGLTRVAPWDIGAYAFVNGALHVSRPGMLSGF